MHDQDVHEDVSDDVSGDVPEDSPDDVPGDVPDDVPSAANVHVDNRGSSARRQQSPIRPRRHANGDFLGRRLHTTFVASTKTMAMYHPDMFENVPMHDQHVHDLDGVASAMHVLLTLATRAGLAASETEALRAYLNDRAGWHERVARELLFNARGVVDEAAVAPLVAHVKRWPPAFAHGGGLRSRLTDAGLDEATPPPRRVARLQHAIKRLRVLLEGANKPFLERHAARRRAEGATAAAADTAAWSLLLESVEDEVLEINVATTRRLNREATGGAVFDALPVAERDAGALVFDGYMAALREGVACVDVVTAINSELAARGLVYVVAEKDNASRGVAGVSAVAEGRAALAAATEFV